MASLSEDPGKRGKTYRIGFLNAERQRKTLRIGAMPKKKAETIRSHVDQLEACLFDGSAAATDGRMVGQCERQAAAADGAGEAFSSESRTRRGRKFADFGRTGGTISGSLEV